MKNVVTILLLLIAGAQASAGENDTIKVYFDLGMPTLNRTAMQQLDSLAYYDILVPNKNYGIIGYADYLGSEESNITLSQNRANAVQEYLQGLGIKPENIETVTGKGEVNREQVADNGYPEDRRVDIVIGGFKKRVQPPITQAAPKGTIPKWSVFFEENTQTENSGLKLRRGQDSVIVHLCRYFTNHGGNIVISGYYYGSNENVQTSAERAEYVKWRLVQCNIRPERIRTVAYGLHKVPAGGSPADLRRADITIDNTPAKRVTQKLGQIDIANIKKDETIRLDNIHFLPGSHKIRSESEVALFHLYIVMKDHLTLKIRLEGHICCLRNTTHDGYDYDTQEYRLSENRAKAVYDYLVEKGIDEERMQYKGFGISKPLVWPERSFADENRNRRVEIRITDK